MMPVPVRPVAVIGLGNPLMGDDGVGVRVVECLKARRDLPPDTELIDVGTGGLALLHVIQGRRRVVLVDATDLGASPGQTRVFTPEEVASRGVGTRFSTHEGDLLRILELAGERPSPPGKVLIMGIQPQRVKPGLDLSAPLAASLDHYAELALKTSREELACTSTP